MLSAEAKRQVDEIVQEIERDQLKKETEELQSQKKAKTMLGLFLGAGLGLFVGYLCKDKIIKFFSVVEKASELVEEFE